MPIIMWQPCSRAGCTVTLPANFTGDGLGVELLEDHLKEDSFLRKAAQKAQKASKEFLAVFPSTTPAALATLATAAWPGQHGIPGWELRDVKAVKRRLVCHVFLGI